MHTGARILRTSGSPYLRSVEFRLSSDAPRTRHRIDCDALGISGGWNPVAQLYCQGGGRLRFDEDYACLVPDGRHKTIHAVGAAAARFDEAHGGDQAIINQLLADLGRRAVPDMAAVQSVEELSRSALRGMPVRRQAATGALGYQQDADRDRTWLDLQHDVVVSDIDLAVRENLTSVEHVKRYTTVGMATDQGKTSSLNALAVLAERTRRSIAKVGTTTFRPMFVPVTLAHS